jgi:hypothetical protein
MLKETHMFTQLQFHVNKIQEFLNKLQGPNFKQKSIQFDLNSSILNNKSIILKIYNISSLNEIFIWNEGSRIKAEIAKEELAISHCRMKPELLLKDMEKFAPDLYKIMGW